MAERDLLDRLEKATGPDRELDIAIADAAMGKPHAFIVEGTFLFDRGVKRTARWAAYGNAADNDTIFVEAPKVTASLDAAIALVEKMFTPKPGWAVFGSWRAPDGSNYGYTATISTSDGVKETGEYRSHDAPWTGASSPTAPIALLIALFRARLSRGEQRE